MEDIFDKIRTEAGPAQAHLLYRYSYGYASLHRQFCLRRQSLVIRYSTRDINLFYHENCRYVIGVISLLRRICIEYSSEICKMEEAGKESEGITDNEITAAIKVLHYLSANLDVYKSPNLRSLRMALQPFINLQSSSMFSGTDAHTLAENKRKNARRKQEAHRGRLEDEKLIQKTVLRAGRMKKLQEIADSNGSNLPALLDGVAYDGVNSTVLSTADILTGSVTDCEKKDMAESPSLRLYNFRACYICKRRFQVLHHFYDSLCPSCADLNWTKRMQTCDMRGKVCLVTGGRVKIGFQCCLKLLRCGATVIATSRFPVDTAKRFSMQTDFADWGDRVHVYGLDLRDLAYVEAFCEMTLRTYPRLDAIINNACQTIRRPIAYYSHLISEESNPEARTAPAVRALLDRDGAYVQRYARLCCSEGQSSLGSSRISVGGTVPAETSQPEGATDAADVMSVKLYHANGTQTPLTSASLSQIPMTDEDSISEELRRTLFPSHAKDVNQQQLDLRRENSWLLRMHEVSSPELAEVFAINSISPFIMVARLKPLLVMGKSAGIAESSTTGSSENGGNSAAPSDYTPMRDSPAHSAGPSTDAPLLSLAEFVLRQENGCSSDKNEASPQSSSSESGAKTFDTAHGARAESIPAGDCSFVVNVSSMEGKFYRRKMASHPHTNMAKAALNMMTRTVAGDYRKDNIFMTAVDTGWINDENPLEKATLIAEEHNFATPLDEIDAAARILDPILAPMLEASGRDDGLCSPAYGCFFKDFFITEW